MILDAIFNLFFDAIDYLINLMPTVAPFDANVSNNLIGIINGVSCFVPVGTFVTAMIAWLVLANIEFIVNLLHWAVRKIPGVN